MLRFFLHFYSLSLQSLNLQRIVLNCARVSISKSELQFHLVLYVCMLFNRKYIGTLYLLSVSVLSGFHINIWTLSPTSKLKKITNFQSECFLVARRSQQPLHKNGTGTVTRHFELGSLSSGNVRPQQRITAHHKQIQAESRESTACQQLQFPFKTTFVRKFNTRNRIGTEVELEVFPEIKV